MTDEPAAESAAESAQQGPQLRLLTQYIKDLSFENPNAPASLQAGDPPNIDLEIGVGATPTQDNIYEVSLTLSLKAVRGESTLFLLELLYCGLFLIQDIPEESLGPVLHIECTRLIFPYARRIISDLTQDGGFPALPLEPIDFAALYRANLEHQAAQQNPAQGNGSDGSATSGTA